LVHAAKFRSFVGFFVQNEYLAFLHMHATMTFTDR